MSASAPAPERTEWRGEGVDAEQLAERLLRMNREHARNAHGHAATRTLNLLVAAAQDVPPDALRARLAGLHARHPSRTIVLREHAVARLDAQLAIDCGMRPTASGPGYCHDAVVLYADAPRLAHADSLVRPLRVAGLPTVLWLPGAQQSPAERPLAPIAQAIVLDSGGAPDVLAAFRRAAALGPERVRDLAWMALARWRQRVAARFEDPAARALLPTIDRVELRCGQPETAAALLLGGWIAARCGWTLTRLVRSENGTWSATGRRRDGAEAAIAVCPPRGALAGIQALSLHGGGATIELVEPVAEPGTSRTLAAALGSFDAPVSGYPPALALLVAALERR